MKEKAEEIPTIMSALKDKFNTEFIMQMFLDNDDTLTVNRSIIAAANVINENVNNLNSFNITLGDYMESGPEVQVKEIVPKRRLRRYYEDVVVNFSEKEYEAIFKVKKSTVQALITFLDGCVSPGMIPLDKKTHIFLMFLISDMSFNDLGKQFGIHKSSVSHIFLELGTVLSKNRFTYISWPSVEEQHLTRLKVNGHFKFPNCVGFIDICRFKVGMKSKKQDTVLLQGVCDESFMFIDVHIGEIGKTKKHKVFKESSLSRELQNFVEFENHILGDSEYKLKLNLITPFNSDEILTSEEMKFNEVHWKTRSYIGRTFELLRERFKKLNHIDLFKHESMNLILYSACVLHNFILMHEGCSEVKEEVITCDDGITLNTDIVQTAEEKRQFLCNYINYIDSSDSESVVQT